MERSEEPVKEMAPEPDKPISRNLLNIDLVASASLRNAVPARATAEIVTATLVSVGLVNENDHKLVVDHKKVDRAKSRVMKNQKLKDIEDLKDDKVNCILFDGRKDLTLAKVSVEGQTKATTVKEEHYSVCTESGKYLFHFTPSPSTKDTSAAEQIAIKLVNWMEETGVSEDLVAIGVDSTNVNTGWKGGAI